MAPNFHCVKFCNFRVKQVFIKLFPLGQVKCAASYYCYCAVKYFKSLFSPKVVLPFPNDPLSHKVPLPAISAANKEVKEVMAIDSVIRAYTPKQKATIGNYALIYWGISQLEIHHVLHFVNEGRQLKKEG